MFTITPRYSSTDATLPPSGGWAGFYSVVSSHFFRLMGLNLLFILGCLPIVTIPASIMGMTAVLQKMLRSEHCFLFETYWKEFRTDFWKRTLLWFGLQLIPAAIWAGSRLLGFADFSILPVSIYMVFVLMLCGYWIPQMSLLSLSPGGCLRNAVGLIILMRKADFLILLIYGLSMLLWLLLWPYSTALLLLGLCAIAQLGICAVVNPVIDAKLLK